MLYSVGAQLVTVESEFVGLSYETKVRIKMLLLCLHPPVLEALHTLQLRFCSATSEHCHIAARISNKKFTEILIIGSQFPAVLM